jgi:hypothetical protein
LILFRQEILLWKELRQSKQEIFRKAQLRAVVANARHLASQLVKHLAVLLTSSVKTAKTNNSKNLLLKAGNAQVLPVFC